MTAEPYLFEIRDDSFERTNSTFTLKLTGETSPLALIERLETSNIAGDPSAIDAMSLVTSTSELNEKEYGHLLKAIIEYSARNIEHLLEVPTVFSESLLQTLQEIVKNVGSSLSARHSSPAPIDLSTLSVLLDAYSVLFHHLDGYLLKRLLATGDISTYSLAQTLSSCK